MSETTETKAAAEAVRDALSNATEELGRCQMSVESDVEDCIEELDHVRDALDDLDDLGDLDDAEVDRLRDEVSKLLIEAENALKDVRSWAESFLSDAEGALYRAEHRLDESFPE
jgi:hypothetical protein